MAFEVDNKADAFKPGDSVQLGNGQRAVVRKHIVSPTGFHSYQVQCEDGTMAGATAPAMVRVGERVFRCRVARSPREHVWGLQGHARLDADEGMLFDFDFPRAATFHMGDVPFPIDIMFVEDGRVARVIRGAQPGSAERWSYPRADAVIEVAAGEAPAVGARVAAPIGRDDQRYKIRFPDEVTDVSPAPDERWKERGLPDTADPNADQMSNKHWKEQHGYSPLEETEVPMRATAQLAEPIYAVTRHRCPHCKKAIHEKQPGRPHGRGWIHRCGGYYQLDTDEALDERKRWVKEYFSRGAQLEITDPADLIVGMIQAMASEQRPLDWHRDALNDNLAYAVVAPEDVASWVSALDMPSGESTDVLDAATSPEGLQVLGDGFVLSGLAQIANVATTDEGGRRLILWTEYNNVA